MEIQKGDKVIIMDGNRNEAPDIADYFIVHKIQDTGGDKLLMSLKFKYKSVDRFLEAKARNKDLRGSMGDYFFFDFLLSRKEAYNKFRRVE